MLKPASRQFTDRAVLQNNVHWLGRRDDIPNLLKSADVLVHASLWEGMPNSVLEAMAAGLPVIGTAVEGNGKTWSSPAKTGRPCPLTMSPLSIGLFSEAMDSSESLGAPR